MRNSGFLLLSFWYRTVIASRGPDYPLSKFFKNFFLKNFAPVFHRICLCDNPGSFCTSRFLVELGFQGWFLNFEPSSRPSGCPTGGRLILTTLYQTPPYDAVSVSIFDPGSILGFRVGPRLSGRNLRLSGRPRLSHRRLFAKRPSYGAKRVSRSE
jgi:hypothetical protein